MTITRHQQNNLMSRVVEYNGMVYLQGVTPDNNDGDITQQTKEVLAKIDQGLALAGSNKSKLLTCLIFLSDIGLRPAMNKVYEAWLDPKNKPTRACVGIQLEGKCMVEIIVTAAK